MKKKKIQINTASDTGSYDINTGYARVLIDKIASSTVGQQLGLTADNILGFIHCEFYFNDANIQKVKVDIPFYVSKYHDIISPLFLRPESTVEMISNISDVAKTLDVGKRQDVLLDHAASALASFTDVVKNGRDDGQLNNTDGPGESKTSAFSLLGLLPLVTGMRDKIVVPMTLVVDSVELINVERLPQTITADEAIDQMLEIHPQNYTYSKSIINSSIITRPNAMKLLSSPALSNVFSSLGESKNESSYRRDFNKSRTREQDDDSVQFADINIW